MYSLPLDSFQIPAQRFIDWMNLIRKTEDSSLRYDYMEAFWESQIVSKQWMIKEFKRVIVDYVDSCVPDWKAKPVLPGSFAYVFGGWHGLAAMFLVDNIPELNLVYSIDKNAKNELMGEHLCHHDKRIAFQTYEMEEFPLRAYNPINTVLVVNTSTEHITQEQYDKVEKAIQQLSCLVSCITLNEESKKLYGNLDEYLEKEITIYEEKKCISKRIRIICKNIIDGLRK